MTTTIRNQKHVDSAIVASAHALRRQIADKRDVLVARQRRQYSPSRQRVIDQLGEQYRAVNQIQIDCE